MAHHYLDMDTTPPQRSRYVRAGHNRAVKLALAAMADVKEGQIGVYADSTGNGFVGYAIRYEGEPPYFEPAEADQ